MAKTINIHAVIRLSAVNGPGNRLVIFFQGCARGCAGCFNPGTHPFEERYLYTARELLDGSLTPGAEGITVSGGEPFMQPEGLFELLEGARAKGLSAVVYTGFTIDELKKDRARSACLSLIDVLIDGEYIEGERETTLLAIGSVNQKVHLLSKRYRLEDMYMPGRVEISIGADGVITETGFSRITPRAANE